MHVHTFYVYSCVCEAWEVPYLFTHSIITAKLRIVAARWVQEAYKSPSILEMLYIFGGRAGVNAY